MKTFQQKKEELAKLQEKLSKSKITIFTSFAREGEKGLNVIEMKELKKNLRANEAEYLVGKKTLLNKALSNIKNPDQINVFKFPGSMGVTFGFGEETSVARTLYTFGKKNQALKFFGALFGTRFIDDKQFIELAKMPNREVVLSRVIGMMKYPLSSIVNVLQANIRNLVGVLGQISKSKSS